MEGCSEPPAAGRSSPVKPLEDVKSPPSDRASSPETNCAICLGKPQNKSFTDSCLHQFCFTCLLEWSKVKAECPLCKQGFTSIIHTVRSIEDYEQYYLHPAEARIPVGDPTWPTENPFRYRTTVTSYLEYYVRFDGTSIPHIIPPAPPRSEYSWRRRRQLGTSDYRRNIYNLNLWVQRTRDTAGRYRECSPEFYRINPAQIHHLVPWLNRELNVLLQESLVQTVMDKILDLLKQYHIRSLQFREALTPYLRSRTDHFIHEFYSFATSPYDMVGYDRNCNYVNYFNIAHELDSSSSSSDSDIQILGEAVRDLNSRTNSSPVAGPSSSYAIEVISESDPDDCLIVGAVKPRHERTPEIITLDSDDEVGRGNTNGISEIAVPSSGNEGVEGVNSGPSCSHKPRTKAQKKQFSIKKRDSSIDSDDSNCSTVSFHLPLNRRRRIHERSAHPRIIWYSDSTSNTSSSDDKSDSEWKMRREKRSHKAKKKKTTGKKKELIRKKRNSKDSKRKSKVTTKHWKKKICSKNGEDQSNSEDSGPIQIPRRRKSVVLSSSPEPENTTLHDHDYPLTNPYSPNDIKKFVNGRPRLRSVVIKHEPSHRPQCNSSIDERRKSSSSDTSRTSKDENDCDFNPASSSDQLFNKWRHQRESSHSSVDSSSRNLNDRLTDLRTDQWIQRPSTSSSVTWLGRHYIDTYSSLNPVRFNLCNSYTSKGNLQDGQSSTSSSSRQHKRKHSSKDKSEKKKKSS